MTLTIKERELLRNATLKPEEFEKLHKMKARVVYTSYYPACVLPVLKDLQKIRPKKRFRLRYQIVEIEDEGEEKETLKNDGC